VAGLTGALGWLLAAVATAMADGSWSRFKTCREASCHWAFYDASKEPFRQLVLDGDLWQPGQGAALPPASRR
jgi:hypothetical protein